MNKSVLILVAVCMVAGVVVGSLILIALDVWPAVIAWTLMLGWMGFLNRVLTQLQLNPAIVAMVLPAVVLFVIGVHWLGRTGTKSAGTNSAARWPWRRSIAATALLFVLVAAGVTMVGITHMTYWLATDPQPPEAAIS